MIFALEIAVLVLANFASTSAMHQVGDMILTDEQYENLPRPGPGSTSAMHKVGDMILTDEQYQHLPADQKIGVTIDNDDGKHENKRNAIKDEDYRWPGGVIPYTFDGSYSRRDKRIVKEAMGIWSKYTCVSFKPANRRDRNKIRLQNGDGCSSMVGMVDGTQTVNLQKDGCRDVATVLHELGHSIGLYHTQSRPDRDQHLVINLSGVERENHYNFVKKTWEEVHHYGVKYDYHSIMHYGSKDFGDESGKVIRTKNPKFQKIIGEAETLSFGDIEMVYKMYKCTPRSCKLKDSDCPGISFVDASCKCLCPGPNKSQLVQPCEGAPTGETGGDNGGTNEEQTTQQPTSGEETTTQVEESSGNWADEETT